MSIRHGPALTLLRQPEPSWQRTKNGEFDTMRRRFKCLTANVAFYLRTLFIIGQKDSDILRLAEGGDPDVLYGFQEMLVIGAEIEQARGDHSVIAVAYEGLLEPKTEPAVTRGSNTEDRSPVPTGGAYYVPIRIQVPKPFVVARYVTNRGRPSLADIGKAMDPPGVSAAETAQITGLYFESLIPAQTTLDYGWRLANRVPTAPGDLKSGLIWRVEDTYEYQTIQVPTP